MSANGAPIHTLHYQGSYAEYAIVPARFVVPTRPDVPLDVVCGLACGISTGLGAAMTRAAVTAGSSVVVIGAGSVGLATMLGALVRGATTIIAIDRIRAKAEHAVELGFARTSRVRSTTCSTVASRAGSLPSMGDRAASWGPRYCLRVPALVVVVALLVPPAAGRGGRRERGGSSRVRTTSSISARRLSARAVVTSPCSR